MTNTVFQFYTEPSNIDYLGPEVRFRFGDLTGDIYSDTIVRTALISGIRFLQNKFDGKYQIYTEASKVVPQPSDIAAGYIRVNSLHGPADLINTYVEGDIYRDPYITFSSTPPPLIEISDEEVIILAAVYLLRKSQISSNAGEFVSWSTEDIRYSNAGFERGLSTLLQQDLAALNEYIKSKLGRPQRANFPVTYIPQIEVVY
jgi:hypothetical protein